MRPRRRYAPRPPLRISTADRASARGSVRTVLLELRVGLCLFAAGGACPLCEARVVFFAVVLLA